MLPCPLCFALGLGSPQDGGGVLSKTAVPQGEPLPQRDRVHSEPAPQEERGDRRGAPSPAGTGAAAGRGGLRPLHQPADIREDEERRV